MKSKTHLTFLLCTALLVLFGCSSNDPSRESKKSNALIRKYELTSSPEIGKFQNTVFYEGGFSSLSYIPGSNLEFYAVTDRGPNLKMNGHHKAGDKEVKLFPFPEYSPKIVRLKIRNNELLYAFDMPVKSPVSKLTVNGLPPAYLQNANSETAWSDPDATLAESDDWGLDAEGISIGINNELWICDEYRPSIWQLSDKDAKAQKVYAPSWGSDQKTHGDILKPLPQILTKIRPNRAFEGITMTPNGTIWAAIQSPLQNPDEETGNKTRLNRFLKLNPETGETQMFLYEMNETKGDVQQKDWKIGDLTAVNDSQLLVLEHAEKGDDKFADVYLVSLNNATPIKETYKNDKTPEEFLNAKSAAKAGVNTVKKRHLLDLTQYGFTAEYGKAEGLTIVNDTTIAVLNDNDYAVAISDDFKTIKSNEMKTNLWLLHIPDKLNWITNIDRKNVD